MVNGRSGSYLPPRLLSYCPLFRLIIPFIKVGVHFKYISASVAISTSILSLPRSATFRAPEYAPPAPAYTVNVTQAAILEFPRLAGGKEKASGSGSSSSRTNSAPFLPG